MSWLQSLFGRRPKAAQPSSTAVPVSRPARPSAPSAVDDLNDLGMVRRDIGRLDKLEKDLGEKLVAYICRGDHSSALLILGKRANDALQLLEGNGWYGGGAWVTGRHDFLLAPRSWRPNAVRRYGEVLAILRSANSWIQLPGSSLSPDWFRALLYEYGQGREAVTNPHFTWSARPNKKAEQPWSIDLLVALLEDDQAPILDAALELGSGWQRPYLERCSPERMDGFDAHLRADPERRLAEMARLSAKARATGLQVLARFGLTEGPYFDFAFDQAGASAKTAREAAAVFLRGTPPATLLAAVEARWPAMKPAHKAEIVRVAYGAGASDLFTRLLERETNDMVRAELSRHLEQGAMAEPDGAERPDAADGFTALDGTWVEVAPPAPAPPDTPISPDLRKAIETYVGLWREDVERYNRENKGRPHFYKQPAPSASVPAEITNLLNTGRDLPHNSPVQGFFEPWGLSKARAAAHQAILNHPDLTIWHLLRAMGHYRNYDQGDHRELAVLHITNLAVGIRSRLKPPMDFRTLGAMLETLGARRAGPMRHLLAEAYFRPDVASWAPGLLAPYLWEQHELLDEALGLRPDSSKTPLSDARALELLGLLPKVPRRYLSALIDRGIGDRKSVRQAARTLLAAAPRLDRLLIPLLEHPKSETRSGAAAWLAERGDAQAVEPLLKAARKEKIPAAKAALLSARSRLGGSIAEFVSPEALLKEAEEGLKKAPAKGWDWFPFDAMPRVSLRDGGELDPRVVRWWILLAGRLKLPGGNPWFDLVLDQLADGDAARLGAAVLQAWTHYDTAGPSDAEANAYAEQHVDARFNANKRWQPNTTREQVFAQLRAEKLSIYFNSGIDQKGVLGLATRVPGPQAVALIRSYFRDHYTRAAQCKALLECLASNRSPAAVQFVLAISKRWRTRGVQDRAGELVAEIAERRGWSPEELADRTIPTGGFDEAGALDLPVGERIYVARLDAEGRIILRNPDGKVVQNLPASAADGDAAALKTSRSLLADARKEVKQVLEFQTQRFYEALCTGRAWPASDWADYILAHPLAGRLAQRLVWMGEGDGRRVLFRPMEDLTLTDAADEAVSLDGIERVSLAHASLLSHAENEAWKTHLSDYEVAPLFNLSRPVHRAVDADPDARAVEDRQGWMIENFKLRGQATKLGYVRTQAEDGGWFYAYEKRFDALGVAAVISFTGSPLPEENRPVALTSLSFVRLQANGPYWSDGLLLSDVPAALLSEAWNDLHDIAAGGSGFDPKWESKSQW